MPIPNTHPPQPSIANTRAVITTQWGKGKAYTHATIRNIEQYYVDTALDNDADTWTLQIGDPSGDLLELLKRDSEIRVQLFGVGKEGINFLMTGLADEADYTDGSWTLTGRDLSSLATDSTVRPLKFQHVRAWAVVEEQAKYLGFMNTALSRGAMVKKLERTDGSETYWEFWYRLYRREKMWIWCEPNGLLIAGPLNYNQPPVYYLGDPKDDDSDSIKGMSIPIISSSLRKITTNRVYEVLVYGHKGKEGFNSGPVQDSTMSAWLKKPRKVLMDTESHTIAGVTKAAYEEIFEGKVGAIEFKITIPDPGFVLRQNRIARLNLPDIGLFGDFYIVGSRIQAGPDGFVQEIRLREKQYAVSRRVPVDPPKDKGTPGGDISTTLGSQISQLASMPTAWGDYFVKAAKFFCGTADFNLFLATLLAIADRETSFHNERQLGGPGGNVPNWYPFQPQTPQVFPPPGQQLPGTVPNPAAGQGKTIPAGETRDQYQEKFANEIGGTYHLGFEYGVGPMQLTDRNLKYAADDRLKPNYRNEYEGGRWHPEHNIWIGAQDLHACWVQTNATRDIDMWEAADAYNRGVAGAAKYLKDNGTISPYGLDIKKKVNVDPGYLATVKGAVQAARDAAAAAKEGDTSFTGGGGVPTNQATNAQILNFFNSYNAAKATSTTRREAIVLAAMFAWHHHSQMHYVHPGNGQSDYGRPRDHVRTIGSPPNIPGNTDCSGFVTWCYFVAGALDPNGANYAGDGYTRDLWETGQHISIAQLKPGDLCFYGSPPTFSHVALYIGSNQVISMGAEGDPSVQPVKMMSTLAGFATYNI